MVINEVKAALPGMDSYTKCSIEIRAGKIYKISEHSIKGNDRIDGRNLLAFPGGIDPHVHFNTPGYEEREDFYHGSCFAASGGVTTVIDMPCTSIPPVTNMQNLEVKKAAVSRQSIIDYAFYGGVSAQTINNLESNIKELSTSVAGIKVYLTSGMESFKALSYGQLKEVFLVCKKYGLPVLIHAEDQETVEKLERKEKAKGSSPINFYNSRPETAELIAIKEAGKIAKEVSADVHIVHVGFAEAVKECIKYGMTAETCPHYLCYNLADFLEKGSVLKVAPVIKKTSSDEEMWQLLTSGKISFITSDHAPSGLLAKQGKDIWEDYSGIAGCGTMLLYLYSEGLINNRIRLSRFLKLISENAAERYGLADRKGKIKEGMDADFVLIDPAAKTKIRAKDFYSKGELTPWENEEFKGKIKYTLRRGKIVYSDQKGITVEAGSGEFLLPTRRRGKL